MARGRRRRTVATPRAPPVAPAARRPPASLRFGTVAGHARRATWTPSSALPAFYECDAGTSWLDGGSPRTVSTASDVVSLTVDATRGAGWPSWFRPLANDDLVPDAVPADDNNCDGW